MRPIAPFRAAASVIPASALALVLVAGGASSCASSGSQGGSQGAPQGPQTIQPGAPGQASRTVASSAAPVPRIAHTAADVAFMQGMIGHHAQALEMTELLKTRSESADMKLLALRIEVSQSDEIRFMQRWLSTRGEAVPGPHAHHAHDAKLMPGMLTPADMARLTAAKGTEFDKLFLEYMIKHRDRAGSRHQRVRVGRRRRPEDGNGPHGRHAEGAF
jgi:uncharacterized protein (DUF305 family)